MGIYKTIKKGMKKSFHKPTEAELSKQYAAESSLLETEYSRLKKQKKMLQMKKEISAMKKERFKSQHPLVSSLTESAIKGAKGLASNTGKSKPMQSSGMLFGSGSPLQGKRKKHQTNAFGGNGGFGF